MNRGTRGRASRRRSAIGRDNTYLGISIDDRSVSMTLAHVDPPDHLLRIAEHSVPVDLAREHSLSMRQIADGVRECWERFEGLQARCIALLLPSWCSGVAPVSGRIPILAGWGEPDGTPAPVRESDVRRLAETLCREGVPSGQVVTGLACERFVHGGRFTVDDPVGAITTELELHGFRFLADAGIARGVLDLLDSLGIEVDVLATPLSALPALLVDAERRQDCLLVEMGQRHTAFGFFRLGRPVRLAEIPWGADDLLAGVAAGLCVEEGCLAGCLASKQAWLMAPEICGAKVLNFGDGRASPSASVGEVDRAIAGVVGAFVPRLQAAMEDALNGCSGLPSRVVVTGDGPVLLRAVAAAGSASPSGRRWMARDVPEVRRDHVDPAITGRTRMAGALRLAALMAPEVQPCLDARRGASVRPPLEDAVAQARTAARRAAGLWASVRPHVRSARDFVARGLQRVSAVLRAARSSVVVRPPAASG